jgi:type IV secretory pathway VirB6-like protein
MATAMPIVDGVIYAKNLVDAMDGAGLTALETAADIVNYLRPAILLSFVLYVILWGWAMMEGLIKENVVMDGVSRILKLAIVMGLVLGFGGSVDVAGITDPSDPTNLIGVHTIGAEQNNTLYIKYVYDFIWN